MKLYMKQKSLSFRARFTIKDELERDLYTVSVEPVAFGRKLLIYDMSGIEVGSIQQKTFSIRPRYFLFENGKQTAELMKDFSILRPQYRLSGKNWEINSDTWAHTFEITNGRLPVASISKAWKTFGDSYEMDISHREDALLVIEIMIAIDCITEQRAFAALAGN